MWALRDPDVVDPGADAVSRVDVTCVPSTRVTLVSAQATVAIMLRRPQLLTGVGKWSRDNHEEMLLSTSRPGADGPDDTDPGLLAHSAAMGREQAALASV